MRPRKSRPLCITQNTYSISIPKHFQFGGIRLVLPRFLFFMSKNHNDILCNQIALLTQFSSDSQVACYMFFF